MTDAPPRLRALQGGEDALSAALAGAATAEAREIMRALHAYAGSGRRVIVAVPGGFAAVVATARRCAPLDVGSAPRFATAEAAELWILRERWALMTAGGA